MIHALMESLGQMLAAGVSVGALAMGSMVAVHEHKQGMARVRRGTRRG